MGKFRSILGLSLAGLASTGYYQYSQNHSFRSICNLFYAGAHMAYIYKYQKDPIEVKNRKASLYLRDALKSNGGIYLKLGQLISTLDVIVPDQYREVMNTLTRQCSFSSFEQVKATIEQDLGYPIDVVFRQLEQKPISSASIGQVHRGTLLNGERVAVKVQHRELSSQVQGDFKLLHGFVYLAKKLFKQFQYSWLVQQFDKNCRKQLDFTKQYENMNRARTFLEQNKFKDIYIPKVLLSPTKRVLTMQFIDGVHFDELERLKQRGINAKRLGTLFSNMIVKMIHKEGYVHADPHSGNLMARKYKGKDQLVLLDHGLYQELDPAMLKNYNQFWMGLILNDPKYYEQAGKKLGTSNPLLLCCMLTSKTSQQLNSSQRNLLDLNPSKDRHKIMTQAAKNHHKIVKVLRELKREVLLLMKVNQFARTIENMMGGREMGVYQDVAKECIENSGLSLLSRWGLYFKLWKSHT